MKRMLHTISVGELGDITDGYVDVRQDHVHDMIGKNDDMNELLVLHSTFKCQFALEILKFDVQMR